jgi:cobalt-zinc-cadmium efflux system membrane fusion protein
MPRPSNTPLIVAVCVSALVAGTAGVLIGRTALTSASNPAAGPTAAAGPPQLTIDNERLEAARIETFKAQAGALAAEVAAPGSVVAAPDAMAVIGARADGAVVRLAKHLGDPVRAGETLALIESRDAGLMAADRTTAAAKAKAAQQAYDREMRLFDAKITARQDLEAAQAELSSAQAELARANSASAGAHVSADGRSFAVTSPVNGRVTAMSAVLGAYVRAGDELYRVADPRRIEVQVAIPQADAGRVAPGDMALVETAAGMVGAVVRAVTPSLDAQTRAATAVLQFTGPAQVEPGQSVQVRLKTHAAAAAGRFVVPSEAVQSVDGRDVVFIRTPQGFAVRPVTVAARTDASAELIAGVASGETIAGKNAFLLKAELQKGDEE